jgi:hypothetical protein
MHIERMRAILGRAPKIIATVRAVPDCAASFVTLLNPENVGECIRTHGVFNHLKSSYMALEMGLKIYPDNFLLVEYDSLVENPKIELGRIHAFLGLSDFEYDLDNIDTTSHREEDWGLPGLHNISGKLCKQNHKPAREVLGRFYNDFAQPEFWLDEPVTKPDSILLDKQLALGRSGAFSEAWEISQELERTDPENNRAAFNRGWYLLRQGQIQKGYQSMDRGRIENVYGNKKLSCKPDWDGKSKGVVLLYLEGGLGDQIHQVRYAKYIAARGCTVIVACSSSLAELFIGVEGVSAVIQHEACGGIFHNYYVAGMSSVVPLDFELKDIDGAAYLDKPAVIKGNKKRIGLRWKGNARFEDDHKKAFPSGLMFDAVKDMDAEFISLQRDEGSEDCPRWVKKVPLDTWTQTRDAVASCDLVITACTSVSHLAAAMGIETWVVIPILPYFLYAMDGETTPYYDSMTLFRQETFGEWNEPFDKIASHNFWATAFAYPAII